MKRSILAFCLVTLIASGCSTDLDVNAPYKEITIVYATLSTKKLDGETTETTHYVKINRAFQGDGDALTYAAIPDSNEYRLDQLVDARVEEWNGNSLVNTFPLNDTVITDRLPGTFYYPEQTVYYFNATLNEDHEYRFAAMVKGKEITARTTIVDDFTVSSNVQSATFKPVLYGFNGYQDYELKWNSSSDGRRYEAYYTFYYREFNNIGDSVDKEFTRLLGSTITADALGGQDLSIAMVGEDFYNTVRTLVPVDPNVAFRKFLGIRFHWAVANDDFHTFLLLQEPITGIVEDRPDFTNISGGYGVFVSRYFERAPGHEDSFGGDYRLLNDASVQELCEGVITGQLGFCSPYSTGTSYACP